ncbi:MAG: hypothetical protein PHG08_00825 [Bacilli bacterium]|nr:hypothetical protein [Bacilli bacterium]
MKKTTIEKIAYGEEPIFDKLEYTNSEFISFLNYYNYNASHDDIKRYVVEYLSNNKPEILKEIGDVPKTWFNVTLGALCRMITRNYPLSNYIQTKIDSLLLQLIETVKDKNLSKPVIEKSKHTSTSKVDECISEIDGFLDFCLDSKHFPKKDFNKYAINSKISKKDCLSISDYYKPLLNELKEAPEDYDTTKQIHEKYIKIVEEIIDTFSTIGRTRKARAKRPVDPQKLVSKVRYLRGYPQYGLTSIDPVEILGKHAVLLYDTKYNKIQLVVGNELTIRGSTIYNIDKESSISKIIKYPEMIQNKFLVGDFEYVLGSFRLLKTKPHIPSGSINDNILILKVF